MKATKDKQHSYADQRRRVVSFAPGDRVLLKVSLTKGNVRVGKLGKLSSRYVGLFEVLEQVGEVAYKLALLPSLSAMYPVFYVSLLRRYVFDQSHQISYEELDLLPNLSYEEDTIQILDPYSKALPQK